MKVSVGDIGICGSSEFEIVEVRGNTCDCRSKLTDELSTNVDLKVFDEIKKVKITDWRKEFQK